MEKSISEYKVKLLNVGCGQRFHEDWTNIDFVSTEKGVIPYNLLEGIPFENETFDVVYHSHVLEHFSKQDGKRFMQECKRVLKKNGIIRVAVPNLEEIAKIYLQSLKGAINGDFSDQLNYEWIMLELFDQTVRNFSGGEMAKYFHQDVIKNEEFVFSRVGEEGRIIRELYFKEKNKEKKNHTKKYFFKEVLKKIFSFQAYRNKLLSIFFTKEYKRIKENEKYIKIGKFRMGGEIHQWMYDRYSLPRLLSELEFTDIYTTSAFDSRIQDWNKYELESKNNIAFKPDSLFIEAFKR
jgi:predicted SAM-dependent methyltransferase